MPSLKMKTGAPPAKKQHPSATSKPHGPYYMHRAGIHRKELKWIILPILRTLKA